MAFVFIGGHVALDLIGTMGRWRTERIELLDGPDRLARWCVDAGVVDDEPVVRVADLERARALRAAIYRLATGSGDGEDRRTVNDVAAAAPVSLRLGDDGAAIRSGDIGSALSTVARAAVELLTGPELENVRECGYDTCTRLYVDHSARGSRRWCDMKKCGNRAKAQAFRDRQNLTAR
ncbi:CGNR zinc finger domain-containing protein [Lentzea sp. JNUCC 0626]|uniref:CGNR zinc finger domain-containing protein n=1 Tax=Lentzea sp. JNUCC 0626 TaxID=3367513 RepID=UPI00374A88F9